MVGCICHRKHRGGQLIPVAPVWVSVQGDIVHAGTDTPIRQCLDDLVAPQRCIGSQPDDIQVPRMDVTVWRAVMGTRLAGVIDLRVDASGSIGVERVKPLLRVLIARGFPVGQ